VRAEEQHALLVRLMFDHGLRAKHLDVKQRGLSVEQKKAVVNRAGK
jgi:hypothetical protein